ncbi:MAG: DoxX family protein [Acidobacteriota bacterium]|nr:DoxX family protein [Acidobacteriota bacterium]
MSSVMAPPAPRRSRSLLTALLRTGTAGPAADAALVAVRVVMVWIFTYYGARKLFGAFHGLGIHGTGLYFSHTAHLHPGEFFAVLGGVIEFGGAIALALGIGARLAGLALFGDMVMAMITVTWSTGIASTTAPPGYQLNLAVSVLALVVVAFGAGRFSLDTLLARRLGGGGRP